MSDQTTQATGRHPYGHRLERIGPYLTGALLSLAIFFRVTELWKADFKVLFTYYIGGSTRKCDLKARRIWAERCRGTAASIPIQ